MTSEVHLRPWGSVSHNSVMVLNAIPPKDLKVTHIQQWFPCLTFMHSDFSLNLFTMLCTIDDERNNVFILKDNFLMKFHKQWWATTPFAKTEPLGIKGSSTNLENLHLISVNLLIESFTDCYLSLHLQGYFESVLRASLSKFVYV